MNRYPASILALLVALLAFSPAKAAEPIPEVPNECANPGGQGEPCATSADCAGNTYATICAWFPAPIKASVCSIPCEAQDDETGGWGRLPSMCAGGEICAAKWLPDEARQGFVCLPVPFRMDLALLDQCVAHFLAGVSPSFTENTCSLQANLDRLLDQSGDGAFDVFDVDLCVLAFLEQPDCLRDEAGDLPEGCCDASVNASCMPGDLVACATNEDCGGGLYCSPDTKTCQRECGFVASREESFSSLERECPGALKVCNYILGKCLYSDVTTASCEVDQDCPAGAYCFLGQCAPNCSSGLDCPDSGWYCTKNNRCRALPPPVGTDGFVFDPLNYAIRFARDELRLNAIQNFESSAMVIMDLITKRQVLDQPAVGFGYRMEITYGLKEDALCLQPFVDCDDPDQLPAGESVEACEARQDDCFVDDTEQWILMASPFGTITAASREAITIYLDQAAADKLSPGRYSATLRLLFDNGDSDSIPVVFTKASPSGSYSGRLAVYLGHEGNSLNPGRPLSFEMDLFVDQEQVWRWQPLMDANNLGSSGTALIDITEGQLVTGRINGHSALSFSVGKAASAIEDSVPFIGIYSPALNLMRLVGVIEIPEGFCITEDGTACGEPDASGLAEPIVARNLFGRTIRRRVEFFGTFEPSIARYHGLYRETITGLSPNGAFTLSGDFSMDQALADSTPITFTKPLLSPPSDGSGDQSLTGILAKVTAFPEKAQLAAPINAEIDAACAKESAAADNFSQDSKFLTYLAQAVRGETTIFGNLLDFREVIETGLVNLGQDAAGEQSYLNVYEYLADWIVPCDDSLPAPPPVCVDETRLRCGLALHQKAIVSGWVNMTALDAGGSTPTAGEQDLFCLATMPTAGCPADADGYEDLFAMQEHNRFWLDLARALKFQGDRARSDAFLTLLRNEVNPFAAGTAVSYKGDRLREAVSSYDEVTQLIVGAPAAAVLFDWPVMNFKQAGNDWLKIMRTVLEDRLGAIAELIDLKRRIFGNADAADLLFANHLLQQEYLLQVYLMALEADWHGPLFSYSGSAEKSLEKGQHALLQLDPAWNPIGVHANEIYFENTDTEVTNWEHYRERLVGKNGDGGELAKARKTVDIAVQNLKASLSDVDALEQSLQQAQWEMEDKLAEICGDPNPGSDECGPDTEYCQCLIKKFLGEHDWQEIVSTCKNGGECPEGLTSNCDDINDLRGSIPYPVVFDLTDVGVNACKSVLVVGYLKWLDGSLDPEDGGPSVCGLDTTKSFITDAKHNKRPCVGGKMGLLIQQRKALDLQREVAIDAMSGEIDSLKDAVESEMQTLAEANGKWIKDKAFELVIYILKQAAEAIKIPEEVTKESTEAADCMAIAGVAAGTDCPQKAVVKVLNAAVIQAAKAAKGRLDNAAWVLENVIQKYGDIALEWYEAHEKAAKTIRSAAKSFQAQLDKFDTLSQQSFDLFLQIEDLRWQAQHALDRYGEKVTFVADHLVGRESGSLLRGEAEARDATEGFKDLVLLSYKMAMAFIHQYNVSPGQAQALVNQALSAVTVDDIEDFVFALWVDELSYCGFAGVDCDSDTNVETLRFSIRELIFPHLTDIVDAQTGKVLTKGQRFHNTITSPPYLKRRIRATVPTDQIEIPIGLPLTLMENLPGGKQWLISPLTCNHLLDASDPQAPTQPGDGNVAVNVVGKNLHEQSQTVNYELVRGPTDYLRSCTSQSVQQEVGTLPVLTFPIRTYAIGYAPQNTNAQLQSPPVYSTHSAGFPACMNQPEQAGIPQGGACWRYFARDRSLASLDWKLVVPLRVGDGATSNGWVAGTGLPENQRPIIEDIVIYFRYRTRSIQE
jgi:hypothetical protein